MTVANHRMPLKTLVVIALRLYAIYWLIESIIYLTSAVSSIFRNGFSLSHFLVVLGTMLTVNIIAIVLWTSASWLSSKIVQGHDMQLAFTSLTKADLYCFAFIFLGVFFTLSSLQSAIEDGLQLFLFDSPLYPDDRGKWQFLWPFVGHVVTLIAGLASVLGARKWTNKLIRMESKNDFPTTP